MALRVIGGRTDDQVAADARSGHHLPLNGIDFMGADLERANLQDADLSFSNLEGPTYLKRDWIALRSEES
jgi:uncharacterized protein YjbI with pentapeptide repeats